MGRATHVSPYHILERPELPGRGLADLLETLDDLVDVRGDQRVVRHPLVADGAVRGYHEDGPFRHAVHAAEGVLFVVLNPELADDLAVEVAQEREVQAKLLGEGLVGAVALDADPEHGAAKLADAVGFVPKLGQFDRSNTAEVE